MSRPTRWAPGRPRERRRHLALIAAVIVAGIVAIAVVAVTRPLGLVAAQLCGGRIDVEVRRYSYKPGQSGTDHRFVCVDGARRRDITDRVVNYSLAGVAVAVLGAVGLGAAISLVRRQRRAGS